MHGNTDFDKGFERYRFKQENDAWGAFSPAERRAWTIAIADFRPFTGSVNTARMIHQQINRPDGAVSLPDWVAIAMSFDAIGFSAHDWHDLMMALHVLQGQNKKRFLNNPAVEVEEVRGQTFLWPVPKEWTALQGLKLHGMTVLRAAGKIIGHYEPRPSKNVRGQS